SSLLVGRKLLQELEGPIQLLGGLGRSAELFKRLAQLLDLSVQIVQPLGECGVRVSWHVILELSIKSRQVLKLPKMNVRADLIEPNAWAHEIIVLVRLPGCSG